MTNALLPVGAGITLLVLFPFERVYRGNEKRRETKMETKSPLGGDCGKTTCSLQSQSDKMELTSGRESPKTNQARTALSSEHGRTQFQQEQSLRQNHDQLEHRRRLTRNDRCLDEESPNAISCQWRRSDRATRDVEGKGRRVPTDTTRTRLLASG